MSSLQDFNALIYMFTNMSSLWDLYSKASFSPVGNYILVKGNSVLLKIPLGMIY